MRHIFWQSWLQSAHDTICICDINDVFEEHICCSTCMAIAFINRNCISYFLNYVCTNVGSIYTLQ